MGKKYLLDTNILIYIEKGISDKKVLAFLTEATINGTIISIMTAIEVLGFNFASLADQQKMELLVADCAVLPLNSLVAQHTIAIRKKHKIKLPDAIIAATALANNCVLVSCNISDFNFIDDLVVVNPF